MIGFIKTESFDGYIKYKNATLTYVLYSLGSWLIVSRSFLILKTSSMSCDLQEDEYVESSMCYSILFEIMFVIKLLSSSFNRISKPMKIAS